MDEKTLIFDSAKTLDPNLLLSTVMNNGGFGGNGNWAWILFLILLFGRNGFGGDSMGTGYLSNQIANGTGRDLLMQAINTNGTSIGQLASTLNCDINSVKGAINQLQAAISSVGAQTGMSAADVKNSITMGNMLLAQQLAQCCCDNKLLVTTQGYEGLIQTLNQTNALTSRIDQLANGITQGFSATAYETAQQTCALQNSLRDNTAAVVAKLDSIEDARKDREIAQLTAALASKTAQAERQAELAPLYKAVNDIQCKLPQTVTLPYSCATAVPTAALYGAYGYGYGNGSIWS